VAEKCQAFLTCIKLWKGATDFSFSSSVSATPPVPRIGSWLSLQSCLVVMLEIRILETLGIRSVITEP